MSDQQEEAPAQVAEAPPVTEPKTAPAGLKIDPNGATVFVEYYPDRMCVQVDYDRTKVKTWDMIIGILEMGILQAKTRRDMVIAENIDRKNQENMRAQQEAFETQMMANRLAQEKLNGNRIIT